MRESERGNNVVHNTHCSRSGSRARDQPLAPQAVEHAGDVGGAVGAVRGHLVARLAVGVRIPQHAEHVVLLRGDAVTRADLL